VWLDWSRRALEAAALRGPLAISDVVFAELSVRFARLDAVESFVSVAALRVERTPRQALFLAGKAFHLYRSQGGARSSPLPDFFIGAHAAVLSVPLLTRDSRRYRSYFPTLELISP
jgi:hypothetical protein